MKKYLSHMLAFNFNFIEYFLLEIKIPNLIAVSPNDFEKLLVIKTLLYFLYFWIWI